MTFPQTGGCQCGASRYEITIENPQGVMHGVAWAEIDGRDLAERPLRVELVDDGQVHRLSVRLGQSSTPPAAGARAAGVTGASTGCGCTAWLGSGVAICRLLIRRIAPPEFTGGAFRRRARRGVAADPR